MIIKKIHLENIRSYKTLELEFPKGSILLAGDIGSGKTTILLAIEFALFGLQPGQKGSALLREGEKEGRITLELEIDDKQIILERKLKRSSKTIGQEDVSIIIEGEKKEMAITEMKNLVLSLINYPPEFTKKTNLLYRFTVYTPQEEMKQIVQEESEARLNTLRYVFGVDKYKTIQENSSLFAARLREEIRKKEGIILNLGEKKNQLEKEKQQLELVKSRILETEKSFLIASGRRKLIQDEISAIQSKIEEKKNLEKEIEKSQVMMAGKRDNIISLNKEKQALQLQIDELSKISFNLESLKLIQEKIDKFKQVEENYRKEFTDVMAKTSMLQSRNQEAMQIKSRMSGLAVCPTCLQNVNQEYKQNVLDKIDKEKESYNQEIKKLEESKNQLYIQINQTKAEIESLIKEKSSQEILKVKLESLEEKRARMLSTDKNMQILESDNELLTKHIFSLRQAIGELTKFDALFKAKNLELDMAGKEEKQIEILLAQQKKEIEFISQDITNLEKEILDKELVKLKLKEIQEFEAWLSNNFISLISFTEKNVMLKLREQFSKLFNEWFAVLVSESLSVRLDEDFSPIISQSDFELDYSYLSGGERTAVALAYRLALNQVINSILSKIKTRDIVILDEPTDGFSETQLDKMRDVLQQLKVKQLILVSHEQKIEGFVDKIIRFKKENGESKIEI